MARSTKAEARKRSQFERALAAFDGVNALFARHPHKATQTMATSWTKHRHEYLRMLEAPAPKPTKSQLAEGIKQGLRETPGLLDALPPRERVELLSQMRLVVETELPGFFERDRTRIRKLIASGRVRSEADWYLLRNHVDEIDGDARFAEELEKAYAMLDRVDHVA